MKKYYVYVFLDKSKPGNFEYDDLKFDFLSLFSIIVLYLTSLQNAVGEITWEMHSFGHSTVHQSAGRVCENHLIQGECQSNIGPASPNRIKMQTNKKTMNI